MLPITKVYHLIVGVQIGFTPLSLSVHQSCVTSLCHSELASNSVLRRHILEEICRDIMTNPLTVTHKHYYFQPTFPTYKLKSKQHGIVINKALFSGYLAR